MENLKRPLSIWITQGILLTASIVFLVLLTISAVYENMVLWSALVPAMLLFVLPLAAFIALAKRSSAGRWLSMMSLLCVAAFMVRWFNGFFGPESYPGISSVLNNGKLLAIFIFTVSMTVLLVVLFLRIGFSTQAAKYFGSLGQNPVR